MSEWTMKRELLYDRDADDRRKYLLAAVYVFEEDDRTVLTIAMTGKDGYVVGCEDATSTHKELTGRFGLDGSEAMKFSLIEKYLIRLLLDKTTILDREGNIIE